MNTVIVRINDATQTIAEHQVVTKDGQPTVIKAVSKVNYELVDSATGVAPQHIVTMRVGDDLHISMDDMEKASDLVIKNYYDKADSALIGLAEDGNYYYFVPDSGDVSEFVTELEPGEFQGQALGGEAQSTPWWAGAIEEASNSFNALPWLAALAGIGLIGAALASSDDGDDGDDGADGKDGKSAFEIWQGLPGNDGKDAQDFIDDITGADGTNGTNGKSAFEIWLGLPGNEGKTEQEFIDAITGKDGSNGESAYDIWLGAGNTGTEQDFLDSLKGQDGKDGKSAFEIWQGLPGNDGKDAEDFIEAITGKDGSDGKSAFEIWLGLDGNDGKSEQDFIDAITGADGSDGRSAFEIWLELQTDKTQTEQDFLDSLKGAKGDDGKSAYEIWLENGNTGSEQDFLDSLKGQDGQDGSNGNNAPVVNILEGDDGVINGSDKVSANQVLVSVILPDDAQLGDKLVVNDKEYVINQEMIDTGIFVPVDIPADKDIMAVSAYVAYKDGTKSAVGKDIVMTREIDNIPPSAPTIDSADANGVTGTVVADEGSETVEITLTPADASQPLPPNAVDNGDGTWTITVDVNQADNSYSTPVEPAEGSVVVAEAVDQAGNKSEPATLLVGTAEIVAAADNFVDLAVDIDPTVTSNLKVEGEPDRYTGFNVVSAGLGPVLGADVLADIAETAVKFTVGENEERQLTMYGDAGGIQVLAFANLNVYKLNESTGQWELQAVKENWIVSYLLAGRSEDTDFTLTEGQWMFVVSSKEGVSALSGSSIYVTKDDTLDYGNPNPNNPNAVSGEATGNVITDDDINSGKDDLPDGTTLTAVDGTAVVAGTATVIDGDFGQLTINADGSYTYVVNDDFRGPFGSEDVFTYEVTAPSGKKSTAELTIQLNLRGSDNLEIDATLVVDMEPTVIVDTADSDIDDAIGFGVLDIGLLGPVLAADALGGQGVMDFTVDDNQVRELTFHGSGGGVDIAKQYSLYIYKLNEDTGQYEQIHVEENWFIVPLLGGVSDQLTLKFGEGTYKATLAAEGGISAVGGNGLYVDYDKIYDYDMPSKFSGEVSGDATPNASQVLVKVDGESVTAGTATVVDGDYGQLTINADGTYTYKVVKPAGADATWVPPYGEVESFNLVTVDATGKTSVDKLNIKISTHSAVDDFNDVTVGLKNLESTNTVIDGVPAATTTVTEVFTVEENTTTSAILKADKTTIGTQLAYTITDNGTGQVVASGEAVNNGTLVDNYGALDVTIQSLAPGEYTVTIERIDGLGHMLTNSVLFETQSFHYDKYEPTDLGVQPVSGSLLQGLDNDAGTDNILELEVNGKSVFVNSPNQGADSIDVEGLYGTLTVFKNGAYSYTPNGETFGVDKFVYETTSVTGITETAVLEINAGQNIKASNADDFAVSSAADDRFMMGDGADTLTFKNLSGTSGGNGGNGLDAWTDFDAAEGDRINISELLNGSQTASNIDQFVKYENGVLKIDRNGNANYEDVLMVNVSQPSSILDSIDWAPVVVQNARLAEPASMPAPSDDVVIQSAFAAPTSEVTTPIESTGDEVIIQSGNVPAEPDASAVPEDSGVTPVETVADAAPAEASDAVVAKQPAGLEAPSTDQPGVVELNPSDLNGTDTFNVNLSDMVEQGVETLFINGGPDTKVDFGNTGANEAVSGGQLDDSVAPGSSWTRTAEQLDRDGDGVADYNLWVNDADPSRQAFIDTNILDSNII